MTSVHVKSPESIRDLHSTTQNGQPRNGKGSGAYKTMVFYKPLYKGGQIVDVVFLYKEFIEMLRNFGFTMYNNDEPFLFVRIVDNVIEEVSVSQIQAFFINFVKHHHVPQGEVSREMILEKIYRQPSHYFNSKRLSLLYPQKPIVLNEDTKKECFLYFRNGFVKCTPMGYTLNSYKELRGAIWFKQKQERDFVDLGWQQLDSLTPKQLGVFYQFMDYISGCTVNRLESLFSITGYMLHGYFDYKLKAPLLTDSQISEKPEGRTGKTLFCKALGEVKSYMEINGKDFDPANKHKYQKADLGTQIICLNDVKRNFDPESVFNDITEGIEVERKNQHPFTIRAKTIINTNKTLQMDGASTRDRFVEFELANYFSDKYRPEDEFGHRFFSDWKGSEWNKFDNLMAFCACFFLKNGMINPEPINLHLRHVVNVTSSDFLDFMDEQMQEKNIQWNEEFSLEELFSNFYRDYPEYESIKKYTFTKNRKKYVDLYCNARGGRVEHRRSHGNNKVMFIKL